MQVVDYSKPDEPTALTLEDLDDEFEEVDLNQVLDEDQRHKLVGDPILRANLTGGDMGNPREIVHTADSFG